MTTIRQQAQVPLGAAGRRFDQALAEMFPDYSRSRLSGWIKSGAVTLDGFGSGHSSLSYLKQLPITRIKLDRSFIGPILRNPQDATLVRAIIALAHTLGLEVVAEGVEEEAQVRFLEEQACDIFQGWFFSRAVPACAIPALFETLLSPMALAND